MRNKLIHKIIKIIIYDNTINNVIEMFLQFNHFKLVYNSHVLYI